MLVTFLLIVMFLQAVTLSGALYAKEATENLTGAAAALYILRLRELLLLRQLQPKKTNVGRPLPKTPQRALPKPPSGKPGAGMLKSGAAKLKKAAAAATQKQEQKTGLEKILGGAFDKMRHRASDASQDVGADEWLDQEAPKITTGSTAGPLPKQQVSALDLLLATGRPDTFKEKLLPLVAWAVSSRLTELGLTAQAATIASSLIVVWMDVIKQQGRRPSTIDLTKSDDLQLVQRVVALVSAGLQKDTKFTDATGARADSVASAIQNILSAKVSDLIARLQMTPQPQIAPKKRWTVTDLVTPALAQSQKAVANTLISTFDWEPEDAKLFVDIVQAHFAPSVAPNAGMVSKDDFDQQQAALAKFLSLLKVRLANASSVDAPMKDLQADNLLQEFNRRKKLLVASP